MSDQLQQFENAVVSLQRHVQKINNEIAEQKKLIRLQQKQKQRQQQHQQTEQEFLSDQGSCRSSLSDLDFCSKRIEDEEQEVLFAQSDPLICELVHSLLSVVKHRFIGTSDHNTTNVNNTTANNNAIPSTGTNTSAAAPPQGSSNSTHSNNTAAINSNNPTTANNTAATNSNSTGTPATGITTTAISNAPATLAIPSVNVAAQAGGNTNTTMNATNATIAAASNTNTTNTSTTAAKGPLLLWNQTNTLLSNRYQLEFIRKRCAFLGSDAQKLFVWILLEISEKSVENLFDHISQTDFIALYDIDSCIRDRFMRLIECSSELAAIPFRVQGHLPLVFSQFVEDVSLKDEQNNLHLVNQHYRNENKTIRYMNSSAFPSTHQESLQQMNPTTPLTKRGQAATTAAAPATSKSLDAQKNKEESDQQKQQLQLQSERDSLRKRIIQTTSKIDFNVSPIARVADESEDEVVKTSGKLNLNLRPVIFDIVPKIQDSPQLSSTQNQYLKSADGTPLPMTTNQQLQIVDRTTKSRPSHILFESRFTKIKEAFPIKSTEISTIESQGSLCHDCKQKISKGIFIIGNNAHFCHANQRWYCSECMAREKKPIWWKALESFDLAVYRISKQAQVEIDRLFTLPLLRVEYDSQIVARHKALYDFMILKRQIYLMYDMVCVPEYVENALGPTHHNLCIKANLFSLKDFTDIHNGTLARKLQLELRLLIQHTEACDVCQKRGIVCLLCSNPKVMYVFDLHNTTLCDRCNTMYHSKCYQEFSCPKCMHGDE